MKHYLKFDGEEFLVAALNISLPALKEFPMAEHL